MEDEQDFNKLLAEAEERGFRRGLNAQIGKKMREPSVWESSEMPGEPTEITDTATPRDFQILGNRRRSIWD